MVVFFAVLAVLFTLLGFAGFFFGGLPTIVFWTLAALCIGIGWKLRSDRQRQRENRNLPGAR